MYISPLKFDTNDAMRDLSSCRISSPYNIELDLPRGIQTAEKSLHPRWVPCHMTVFDVSHGVPCTGVLASNSAQKMHILFCHRLH